MTDPILPPEAAELRWRIENALKLLYKPYVNDQDYKTLMMDVETYADARVKEVLDRLRVDVHPHDGNDEVASLIDAELHRLERKG